MRVLIYQIIYERLTRFPLRLLMLNQQRLEISDFLVKLAKASKYRKPRNANGSLARYFYEHLNKRVKIEQHYSVRLINREMDK